MTSAKFIGAIDLSVRLSSMNPLGYLDLAHSTVLFERSILRTLEVVWQRSRSPGLLEQGIIKGGDVPKGFELDEIEDLVEFVSSLRSKLLEDRLPFKICVRVGVGVGLTLTERWSAVVSALRAGGAQREALKSEIENAEWRLGTSDPDVIERYFKLHRPLASTDNTADLQGDLEGFKGLGFHADVEFEKLIPDSMKSKFFVNYYPSRVGKTLQPRAFVDLLWPFSPYDLVSRYVDNKSEDEDGIDIGSVSLIANVFEMMRRSLKASESNGLFYISLINAFVISSSFSHLMYIEERYTKEGSNDIFVSANLLAGDAINLVDANESESQYSIGWQNYPPIFRAVLLDPDGVRLLKKSPGSEIVLATLLERVWCRKVETDLVNVALAEHDLEPIVNTDIDPEQNSEVERGSRLTIKNGARDSASDSLFDRLVREVERRYSETMLRKMFNLPDDIISSKAKKNALRAATSIT